VTVARLIATVVQMSLMLGNPQAKISGIGFKHGPKGRREPETERSEGEGD
jgi:hypothetical protein